MWCLLSLLRPTGVDELAAALFGATISDEGPSNPHASRLRSSRGDYQEFSEGAFPKATDLDLEDILSAIERMSLAGLPDPAPDNLEEVFGGLPLYSPSDMDGQDNTTLLPQSPPESQHDLMDPMGATPAIPNMSQSAQSLQHDALSACTPSPGLPDYQSSIPTPLLLQLLLQMSLAPLGSCYTIPVMCANLSSLSKWASLPYCL